MALLLSPRPPAHLTEGPGGRQEREEEGIPWSLYTGGSEIRTGPGTVWLMGKGSLY